MCVCECAFGVIWTEVIFSLPWSMNHIYQIKQWQSGNNCLAMLRSLGYSMELFQFFSSCTFSRLDDRSSFGSDISMEMVCIFYTFVVVVGVFPFCMVAFMYIYYFPFQIVHCVSSVLCKIQKINGNTWLSRQNTTIYSLIHNSNFPFSSVRSVVFLLFSLELSFFIVSTPRLLSAHKMVEFRIEIFRICILHGEPTWTMCNTKYFARQKIGFGKRKQ